MANMGMVTETRGEVTVTTVQREEIPEDEVEALKDIADVIEKYYNRSVILRTGEYIVLNQKHAIISSVNWSMKGVEFFIRFQ